MSKYFAIFICTQIYFPFVSLYSVLFFLLIYAGATHYDLTFMYLQCCASESLPYEAGF